MPALPSSAPYAPSFLPSPLVGLGIFIVAFVVVTSAYAITLYVACKVAERCARGADVEKTADAAVAKIKTKANGSPRLPADSPVAGRDTSFNLKAAAAAKNELITFHKQLMEQKQAPSKIAPVVAPSVARRFLKLHNESHAAGRVGVRQKRPLPGPSSLRLVHTASQPAPVCVSPSISPEQPESTPAPAPVPFPSTVLDHPAVAVIPVGAKGPTAVLVPPAAAPAPASAKGPAALILAALARGDDSDSDYGLDYDDDEDAGDASLMFSFDAMRGVRTTVNSAVSSASVSPASIPLPATITGPALLQPRVLVDSGPRTLRRAALLKRQIGTPKRTSKGTLYASQGEADKENSADIPPTTPRRVLLA